MSIKECGLEYKFFLARDYKELRKLNICGIEARTVKNSCFFLYLKLSLIFRISTVVKLIRSMMFTFEYQKSRQIELKQSPIIPISI